MAEVNLEIGGWRYDVACRDGEEDHLRRLAALVDAKSAQARASVGGVNEVRQLLLAALLLADELSDARGAAPADAPAPSPAEPNGMISAEPGVALALERLAERVERMADRLEGTPASP